MGSEIEGVDVDIKTLIMDNEASAESWRILRSIPGIGVVNAVAMICWMPERGILGNRQVAARVGVALCP